MASSSFKRLFMRGLAALLPTIATIALLAWAFGWINSRVATPITDWIITWLPDPEEVPWFFSRPVPTDPRVDALRYGHPLDEIDPRTGAQLTLEYKIINHPACYSDDPEIAKAARQRRAQAMWHIAFAKLKLNVIGFAIAIVIVYFVGYFISGLLGRSVWQIAESMVLRVPLIRSVYPNIKQVTDFLLGDRRFEFAGVVAAEYPRKGIWSLGLVTGPGMRSIQRHSGAEMVTIFIPSSPTPITGYTITVPRSDVIELALSIDEALRFTISGGVIKPPIEGGPPEMALGDASGAAGPVDAKNPDL